MKRTLTTAVATLALVLCASQAGAQAAGSYKLMTIGGARLPAAVAEKDVCREEVEAAVLTLNADGTWTLSAFSRESCGRGTSTDHEVESGKYTVSGETIRFTQDDDKGERDADDLDPVQGALEGDMLNIRLGVTDRVFTFKKQ